MANRKSINHLARTAGAGLGIAAAALLLLSVRPSSAVPGIGATVRFTLVPTGELEARPAPPAHLLVSRSLAPRSPAASGDFTLRNQSGSTLLVNLRAKRSSSELDGLLRVTLSANGRDLGATTLQALRHGAPVPLRLAPGRIAHLELSARIPNNVTDGYQGRLVNVDLIPATTVVGR